MRNKIAHLLLPLLTLASVSTGVFATEQQTPPDRYEPVPPKMARDTAGLDKPEEHRGDTIPLDAVFTDSTGQEVKLGDYFNKGRPVILQMGYLNCPMICDVISKNIVESVKSLDLSLGSDYDVLYVSINPEEKWPLAQAKKRTYVEEINKPGAANGWNFLVGQDANIQRLAKTVGFKFNKIEGRQEFAHQPMIVILTADGKISRYFYGWQYPSSLLRTGLVEAGKGKIGGYVEQLIVSNCYHFDEYTGKYTFAYMNLMKAGGVLTVLIVLVVLGRLWLRDWRASRRPQTPHAA